MENVALKRLLDLPSQRSLAGKPMLLMLVTSTCGAGEPPDNVADFHVAVKNTSENNTKLRDIQQAGNDYDEFFGKPRYTRLCSVGAGDDNTGTTDEDFQEWKDRFLHAVASNLRIEARSASSVASTLKVREEARSASDEDVYIGERNETQLRNNGLTVGPFTASDPYYATDGQVGQLFHPACGRHCLHVEFDVSGTDLAYEPGDHLAMWPLNPEVGVERALHVFGPSEKRSIVFGVDCSTDTAERISLPTSTTSDAALQIIDFCGPVSRLWLEPLSTFAPTQDAGERIQKLANNKDHFETIVHTPMLNLAQLLELNRNKEAWPAIPFTFILDNVLAMRPRHYSISSSSRVSPLTIHATAAIKVEACKGRGAFKCLIWSPINTSSTSRPFGFHNTRKTDVVLAQHTRFCQGNDRLLTHKRSCSINIEIADRLNHLGTAATYLQQTPDTGITSLCLR